ncbi:hypothetical protein [Bordetella genomosp. 11]|uniref:hypothetical protein n=1 Tax=Bordetella genomosp. 11 TaxID=1416808 RepID=UPI00113FFCD6|nr:hypothetical protein [Bordetella genomosp. 11]
MSAWICRVEGGIPFVFNTLAHVVQIKQLFDSRNGPQGRQGQNRAVVVNPSAPQQTGGAGKKRARIRNLEEISWTCMLESLFSRKPALKQIKTID